MPHPIIALLTDFGTRDHYVAAMKGVILGICPAATLVDITHEIAPQDVPGAARELEAARSAFPAGTVFLVVVDPGVGTGRRGIVAEAGGHRFVGPDNGVLAAAIEAGASTGTPARVVELTSDAHRRPVVSRTFEGRDRFAPAAAWLAAGVSLDALGPIVQSWEAIAVPQPSVSESGVSGEVVRVDRFGNLVTNLPQSLFDASWSWRDVRVTIGTAVCRIVGTYAEAEAEELCALFGSTAHLEVAVNGGSAAVRLGLGRGAPVTILRGQS